MKKKATPIWSKSSEEQSAFEGIHEFTVGRDREFDLLLAPFDMEGTKAHTTMLERIGLLSREELSLVLEALDQMLERCREGRFSLDPNVEDVHSQIEYELIQSLGAVGEKIHTGRSRNDQVLTAIKLYLRSEIQQIAELVERLFVVLTSLAGKFREELMPGYTHYQIAMPSSVGLWLSSYAESLTDDLELLSAAQRIALKNPLGSGAGYGSSFPLDRRLTTDLLGFKSMHVNSIYAQKSRGKTERFLAVAMASIGSTIGGLSNDLCLYLGQNFGFFSFPDTITTGSSIMPHKKNPDVFELIRAKTSRLQSLPSELTLLSHNLATGYNRDMQLTKEILFPAIQELKSCLKMLIGVLPELKVEKGLLNDPKYEYLFSVEKINQLMQKGTTFRQAYQEVGKSIQNGCYTYEPSELHYSHVGSIGVLGLDLIGKDFYEVLEKIKE